MSFSPKTHLPSNIVPWRDNHIKGFLMPSVRRFLLWVSVHFVMQSGVPACRISSDCVLPIYDGVNSEAALTSKVISVAGSHLLLYSWLAQFPLCPGLTEWDSRLSPLSISLAGTLIHNSSFWVGTLFSAGLGRHTGRKRGKFRWKAKSVYNQPQHLRWPNGRRIQLPFSLYEGAFFVHLMYKYTTTDTTLYTHLTMVISVATWLCKIACFHIKSPPVLVSLSWSFTFQDITVSRDEALRLVLFALRLSGGRTTQWCLVVGVMAWRRMLALILENFAVRYKFNETAFTTKEQKRYHILYITHWTYWSSCCLFLQHKATTSSLTGNVNDSLITKGKEVVISTK